MKAIDQRAVDQQELAGSVRKCIDIKGAREHNLKDVDLKIPSNALVVFTGVSGSGKSSLAFDTLYAEGERRFTSTLSAYARQFLGQLRQPDVDRVTGLSPTLAIDQKTVNRNPRSTVGTITELLDHLRLLMARLGTPRCPVCNAKIRSASPGMVADSLLRNHNGERLQLLAPIVRDRKGTHLRLMNDVLNQGWVRGRVDGEQIQFAKPPALEHYEKHTVEVVVDRVVARHSERARLIEAIEVATKLSGGVVGALINDAVTTFSTDRACPNHPEHSIPDLEPRLFSFNAPQGACQTCNGLGELARFDLDLLFDRSLPPTDGFHGFCGKEKLPFIRFTPTDLKKIIHALNTSDTLPLNRWPKTQRDKLLYGSGELTWTAGRRTRPFRGLVGLVERTWRFTHYKPYEAFRVVTHCGSCNGSRLNPIASAVEFFGETLPSLNQMTILEAHDFFEAVVLPPQQAAVGKVLIEEISARLGFLVSVGLDYLTLDRTANTLSGGESQRIRLSAAVGSPLQGVTYILDEPSIGLHSRDNSKLLNALKQLRDRGNSVLVVEHDADTILAADHVVEIGPGAGVQGGEVVVSESGRTFPSSDCLTAAYLRRERVVPMLNKLRKPTSWLKLKGASANNLNNLTVKFPLGVMCCVTGVSGSGKSSLVFESLIPAIKEDSKRLSGLSNLSKVVTINQQPIGRTPRSNPATYTGAMSLIRVLFAQTRTARALGFTKSRFSFNVKGGRCEECQGAGSVTVEMQLLPDVQIECESCKGLRYNRETLEVRYLGHSIADVLALSVLEASELFSNHPKLGRILNTLLSEGLNYLTLGQPSTTLSGGEAQRIKLARELHKFSRGATLYILDEPTTGLHFQDIELLLNALDQLVDLGNTVLIIEHNTDIIKRADYLIDIGPDGGCRGGDLVGAGTPKKLAKLTTATGLVLASLPEFGGTMAEPTPSDSVSNPVTSGVIAVEGAALHNLNDVSLTIPHGKFNVLTGVSGSGKTSLAFGTIFSEGQRKYVECLSTYARRFLGRASRPPVRSLAGLSPAVAVDRGKPSRNPRSTVATTTEIHDLLRVLYARVGVPHCPDCGVSVRAHSASSAATALGESGFGRGWIVAKTTDSADDLLANGFNKLLLKNSAQEAEVTQEAIEAGAVVVIDRVKPTGNEHARVSEAISSAYKMSGEVAFIDSRTGHKAQFTERPCCHLHGPVFEGSVTPRHFSFNASIGACRHCDGLGYVADNRCPACEGARMNPAASAVEIDQTTLPILLSHSIADALDWSKQVKLNRYQSAVAVLPLQEIKARLSFLCDVGVGYLGLDRVSRTLSSGEAQRLRLASLLGVGLTSVNYVLDEPTVGLHKADTKRLLQTLTGFRDRGNTLLVVEHDLDTIRAADHVIDMGPGAGIRGGEVVAQGTPTEIAENSRSVTGRWLSGASVMPAVVKRRKPTGSVTIQTGNLHNLKFKTIKFPMGLWTAVTGVSGAGKSTLACRILAPDLAKGAGKRTGNTPSRVVVIDGSPLGGTPRSTPATAVKAFSFIRTLLSKTKLAKERGYKPGRFSFNTQNGWCPQCKGRGSILIQMHFLPDVWVECHLCDGARYDESTLEVRYRGRNIGDILAMRVDEAIEFFKEHRQIHAKLKALSDVGLDYLSLGQPGNQLSSGEALRVKLAFELTAKKGHVAYILDEPTNGLHLEDVSKLVGVLHKLVDSGHTVCTVVHRIEMMKQADYLVDLGPGGGEAGGEVVSRGTPEQIAQSDSLTGHALR